MRTLIIVTLGVVVVFGTGYLLRDVLRPPIEVELRLTELTKPVERSQFGERLTGITLDCSDDGRIGSGDQVCFAPVTEVDGLPARYLALFFDDTRYLTAINIVIAAQDLETVLEALEERLGEASHIIEADNNWRVWHLAKESNALIMAHDVPPESGNPALLWFRDAKTAERLLPH
ncbi:hypothetical protein CKO15_11645 [Halorhodospira abdelmalekii]|uniref:hypothetical protein n=1 Tax=Halorhodospira abdelmalekii TaxID=421629 RepID=UPI001906B88B|nr:hypothetical protein [Halorhodospira abdelmalekii]MBK1735919.1 hypothetical protein [Halorhodospira abdelmalekii]